MKKLVILCGLLLSAENSLAGMLVILDEGTNTNYTGYVDGKNKKRSRNNIVKESCYSLITKWSSTAPNATVLHGSLCNHPTKPYHSGAVIDTQGAAEYKNTINYVNQSGTGASENISVNITQAGAPRGEHGNVVANSAYDFDRTVRIAMWQVFGIDRTDSAMPTKWVTRSLNPSNPNGGGKIGQFVERALNIVATTPTELVGVGAVNISLAVPGQTGASLCVDGFGEDWIDLLHYNGIAVVAGLANTDIPATDETWPACFDKVIKVGSRDNASNGLGIGIGAMGIDYFAKGETDASAGNSLAAPKIAAAFAHLHRLFPGSSVRQKMDALNDSASSVHTYHWHTKPYFKKSDLSDAIKYLSEIFKPVNPISVELDYNDAGEYGSFYEGANADDQYIASLDLSALEQSPVALKVSNNFISNAKDVLLSFDSLIRSPSSSSGFTISVNGTQIDSFGGHLHEQLMSKSIVINRNLLSEFGINNIEIKPLLSHKLWGVTNVRMTYLPTIDLALGQPDTATYGYDQNPTRYTGLRAEVQLAVIPEGELVFSAQGWDIDVDDETAVFFNGSRLGFLTAPGSSSSFGPVDRFVIPQGLAFAGPNYIEFVQRAPEIGVWEGPQDEKWAVKNLLLRERPLFDPATIVPTTMILVLDDDTP